MQDTKPVTLTEREHDAYEFVEEYIGVNGNSPSYDDVATNLDVSLTRAALLIRSLLKKGALEKSGSRKSRRSLKIPKIKTWQ